MCPVPRRAAPRRAGAPAGASVRASRRLDRERRNLVERRSHPIPQRRHAVHEDRPPEDPEPRLNLVDVLVDERMLDELIHAPLGGAPEPVDEIRDDVRVEIVLEPVAGGHDLLVVGRLLDRAHGGLEVS